ncbi:arylsulfatase J-like [Mercenaria mercenaria]|uniref:arylsulfatase J-like n=1 Tax=Mercenaria mercenaria TaxID=6596 RepID=UPI00234F40CB|nr:arylsulfatase J-like [Mercenaria mercenaria]
MRKTTMVMNREILGALWLTAVLCLTSASATPRHIVFIVADDLGWNDVGFHNPTMFTPNIDKLAYKGVILNSSYVQPVCTPSRNSWMTGIYPFKLGMQRGVIIPGTNECSPLDLEFFPQKLQKLGYSTHIIGKWHLGSCSWNCTPMYRGFDSFYGYYEGKEDYYTKVIGPGIDFHENKKNLNDTTYSAYLYADRGKMIINNHNKSKPLFLYIPFQSVHSPIQVPKRFEDMYPNIKTQQRRQYCGMVSAVDEAIGNITTALTDNGMMDDTLIIFTTDNGGMPTESGNNYPLRGGKTTIFEGGTRAISFVVGAGVEKSGYTYNGLMHAVDWHPTIVAAAGGTIPDYTNEIDGINQWEAISTGSESNRKELVYNLDSSQQRGSQGHAAIRVGDFKLIQGYPGPFSDWYKPDQIYSDIDDELNENDYYARLATEDKMKQREEWIKEGYKHDRKWAGDGLYNLKNDPTEHEDVSESYPDVVNQLKAKLDEYWKSYVEPKTYAIDPRSDPRKFGGFWTPGWC